MTEITAEHGAARPTGEPVTLHTADGLTLVGELALPLDRPPAGDADLPAPAADARAA